MLSQMDFKMQGTEVIPDSLCGFMDTVIEFRERWEGDDSDEASDFWREVIRNTNLGNEMVDDNGQINISMLLAFLTWIRNLFGGSNGQAQPNR